VDSKYRRSASALGLIVALLIYIFLPSAGYSQTPRDVVFSEIAWMGTTTSSNDEWIELYNNTDGAIDLTGWTLNAADGTPSIQARYTTSLRSSTWRAATQW
jgi:hypothetical protein